jgi:hypothetical protein
MAEAHTKLISCSDITLLSGRNSSKPLSYSDITLCVAGEVIKTIFLFCHHSLYAGTHKNIFLF